MPDSFTAQKIPRTYSDLAGGTVAVSALPVAVASGPSHSAGAVPDPGATPGTARYLREDLSWATPPSAGPMGASGPSHAQGLVPDPGSSAGTAHYLREDGTWAVPPSAGPMVGSGPSHAAGLAPDPGATPGTAHYLREDGSWSVPPYPGAMGASGPSHAAGLAPDPGGSAGTSRFLREDGQWQAPPTASVFGPSGGSHSTGVVPDPGATIGTVRYLREDATWHAPPTASAFGPSGPSHAAGVCPDPGATPGSSKFLREDGTWVVHPGGRAAGWFDVRDYGAVADGGTTDNSPFIQAAIDAAGAQVAAGFGGLQGAVVFIPAAPQYFGTGEPIWLDWQNVQVVGAGPGAMVRNLWGFPAFIVGQNRLTRQGLTDSTYRPASTVLDGSAGARPVFALGNKVSAVVQGGPLQIGAIGPGAGYYAPDYWGAVTKFTIQFCIEYSNWGTGQLSIFGLWDGANPRPIAVTTNPDTTPGFTLALSCADQAAGAWRYWQFPVTHGQTSPYRVTMMCDLGAGVVKGWVNDVQETPAAVGTPAFTGSTTLQPCDGMRPFLIGTANGQPSSNAQPLQNCTIHGMHFANGLIYSTSNPTLTFAPAYSGMSLNDNSRYFHTFNDSGVMTIGLLSFLDSVPTCLQVSWGGYPTAAVVINKDQDTEAQPAYKVAVRNLEVGSVMQHAVLVGCPLFLELSDLHMQYHAGTVGIGSLVTRSVSVYPVTIERCLVGGTDAAFVGYGWLGSASRVTVLGMGRQAFRHGWGSFRYQSISFLEFSSYWETLFDFLNFEGGNSYGIFNCLVDNEGSVPSVAFVRMALASNSGGSDLTVDQFKCGEMGTAQTPGSGTALMVKLTGTANPGSGLYRGTVNVRNMTPYSYDQGCILDVESPPGSWSGTFDATAMGMNNGFTVTGAGAASVDVTGSARVRGAVAVAHPATSGTFAHGLPYAPPLSRTRVDKTSPIYSAGDWSVTTDATHVTVTLASAPGTGNTVTFQVETQLGA
jgi:hypothetical protein